MSVKFKYIDRQKPETAVLVPGWATDYRIFDTLDLDYNYLMPGRKIRRRIEKRINRKSKGRRIRLCYYN